MSWRELLPPWLVIVAGLTGIVLLCVSTKDVPMAPLRTKVRALQGRGRQLNWAGLLLLTLFYY